MEFNAEIPYADSGINEIKDIGQSVFYSFWFWLIVFFAIIFVVTLFFLKKYFKKVNDLKSCFEKVVLLIILPKESGEKEGQAKKSIKDFLAPMESLFDNIGGLKPQKGWMTWFFGRSDNFAFEIISDKEGIISFYFIVSRKVQQYFEQQIHARYPSANIEEVNDYNVFLSKGTITSATLKLKSHSMFSIKTYLKGETDPLDGILNSLSRIPQDEAAAIQIIARSSHGSWRLAGVKVAAEMQQGKTLSEAMQSVFSGWQKVLRNFINLVFPKTKKETEPVEKKLHQLSPMEQETIKALGEKANKAGLDVNIRIIISANSREAGEMYLNNIVNAFAQYSIYECGNSFKKAKIKDNKAIYNFIYRIFDEKSSFVLNTEEMASIYHFPISTTETPNIRWLTAKKAPAPVGIPEQGLILGYNLYRGEKKIIRIQKVDRQRHVYIIGRTGTGKSKLMAYMAIQDIMNGEGICVIDPHGSLIDDIIERIPKERAEDVIYFDPSDTERPMGLNLLEYDPQYPSQKGFIVNEMINIFDKLYDLKTTGGPIFEQYMRNAMQLIMEHPESGATLMEIPKILSDPDFRKFKLKHCKNPVVYDFWVKEAEKAGGEASLANMTTYLTSKLNQFVANDMMRPIIGQQKSAFNFRKIMDERKILLINLSKGKIGDMNAYLLGLVLVGKILMASLSRADMPEDERKDFYLYIDEFQNFITDSINTILAEARKYKLCLNLGHQYIGQLNKGAGGKDSAIRDAIFGTVGTLICYKVGVEDAEFLAKEFAPVFNSYDLINAEKFTAYIKLLVNNQSLLPFNLKPPYVNDAFPANQEVAGLIKELSRLKYGRDRATVEKEILERVNIVTQKSQKQEETEFEK